MSGGSSWRSPSTADQYRHHDFADFAQEFLQRNVDYRRDHAETEARILQDPHSEQQEKEGLAGRWALAFPTAPDADPRTTPALWSPLEAPDVVLLATADIQAPVELPLGCEPLVEAMTDCEHHLVVALNAARLRLCLRTAPTSCPDCLIIVRDGLAATRLAAAARFERASKGRRIAAERSATPSGYQRERLTQLLALHDALGAGASARDVAFGLVMPNHRPLVGPGWKGSGERRHVLRLIAEARRVVGGGYLKLLRHG